MAWIKQKNIQAILVKATFNFVKNAKMTKLYLTKDKLHTII